MVRRTGNLRRTGCPLLEQKPHGAAGSGAHHAPDPGADEATDPLTDGAADLLTDGAADGSAYVASHVASDGLSDVAPDGIADDLFLAYGRSNSAEGRCAHGVIQSDQWKRLDGERQLDDRR